MNRNTLEEYKYIKMEIDSIESRIHKLEGQIYDLSNEGSVIDKVNGGDGGIQSYRIEGFPYKRYNELKQKLNKLRLMLIEAKIDLIDKENEIEEYIECLDGRERTIFRMLFIENRTQTYVAMKMNVDQSLVSRIVKENLEKL